MTNQTKTPNYDYFIKANTSAYKGEWIAIAKNKIIAHGKDAQKVYQRAKQKNIPVSLAKVPDEQLMVQISPFSECGHFHAMA